MSPLLQRSARLGLVPGLCIAIGLVFGQSATAQYTSDFESPLYNGSAAGTIITGQDGFYIPVPDSQDGLVYTYAGNALGLPTNPSGGGKQFAGVTGGDVGLPVPFARAQRDVVYGAGTGAWTVSFDIAATFIGDLPSEQNIGSFSTQVFPSDATYIALATWTDPATAANWDARYVWYDVGGGQLNEAVADPGFQSLATDHWYRWSTTFNLDTNQIVLVSITDLTTNVTISHSPVDRYLVGGAAGGAPPPSGFRLFGGSAGVAGNTLAFDNVDIDLASGTPSGACCFVDETCDFLTEADCLAADGLYSGDWIACTVDGCLPIPKVCGKGAGPCNDPNESPGCEDELCCALVCDLDPLCCILVWDQTCADIAAELPQCQVPPPPPMGIIVYDNSTNFLGFLINGVDAEWGDGVTLAGTERIVQHMQLMIHANGGDATADVVVRIYEGGDDWMMSDPGALLWTSDTFAGFAIAGGSALYNFAVPNITVPDTMTWTLELTNVLAGGAVGSRFNDPPTLGSSENSIWLHSDGVWTQFTFKVGGDNNFGAVIRAVSDGKECPWDLDNGGFVGAGDLLLLLAGWGNPYGAVDLLALLADWGVCP